MGKEKGRKEWMLKGAHSEQHCAIYTFTYMKDTIHTVSFSIHCACTPSLP